MRTKTQHKNDNSAEGDVKVGDTEMKMEEGEEGVVPPLVIKKPPVKPKRKYKKRKVDDEEHEENKHISKSIQQRFGKNKNTQELAVIKHTKNQTVKIVNPDAHDNMIERAEELKINKMYQVELRSDALPTAWKCALCHQRTCRDSLGDLFGPYYVQAEEKHWPEFLTKKPAKMARSSSSLIDIWMHGSCALWAPDVHMAANQLENLEEKLNIFWGQSCFVCHQSGASIPVDGKYLHFPCAMKHPGVVLDQSTFTCKTIPAESSR
ncbi:hypothetical protein PRIPAC_82465 [Pristionchus pacificus]|uniref:Uncharacterized protein n=1 Tax=Pristionchus pacificus TaxID=54126 RepID=A0A454XSV0_PRIPA|nr:hypothetical protein PRIPAC_82465 [Pristionchus pacificus]|eukprot:PDM75618.1 hypothetical protein PRIPAC_42795 [Pristionchus pacificus]